MTSKRVQGLSTRGIPQPDRPVKAGGSQQGAVRRRDHRRHQRSVSLEGGPFPTGGHVPELDGVVVRGGRWTSAVGVAASAGIPISGRIPPEGGTPTGPVRGSRGVFARVGGSDIMTVSTRRPPG